MSIARKILRAQEKKQEWKMKILRGFYEKPGARLFNIFHSERGQTLVEYGLLLVLIAIVVYLMVKGVGGQANCIWSRINSGISQ